MIKLTVEQRAAISQAPGMLDSYIESIKLSGMYEVFHYIPEIENTRDVVAEVMRLNGITGDWRGEAAYLTNAQGYGVPVKGSKNLPPGTFLYATPPQQQQDALGAVPDGFVLVPVEPTLAMIEAGYRQYTTADKRGYSSWRDHLAVHRAMLSAAPKPQEPGA